MSASAKLIEQMKELREQFVELRDEIKLVNIENNKKLTEINIKIDSIVKGNRINGAAKSRSAETSSNTPKGATFSNNSMIWWKNRFENEEKELLKNYCNSEMIESLNNYLETNDNIKKKVGPALAKGKAAYLWANFIKNDISLKKKIKSDFDQAKAEFFKNQKTPASKEDETPPTSPEGK